MLAALGCNGNREKDERIVFVVCTTGMVADLVRNVGGEPRCQSINSWGRMSIRTSTRRRSGDVDKLRQADIIFYSGLHLEGKMADDPGGLGKSKPTFAVAERFRPGNSSRTTKGHWTRTCGLTCRSGRRRRRRGAALADLDKANADEYGARATAYRKKLEALHGEVKKQIASIPQASRVLVTSHDAFRYFGRAYDIEVKSVQGISTDAEPSVKDINDLVDFICRRASRPSSSNRACRHAACARCWRVALRAQHEVAERWRAVLRRDGRRRAPPKAPTTA